MLCLIAFFSDPHLKWIVEEVQLELSLTAEQPSVVDSYKFVIGVRVGPFVLHERHLGRFSSQLSPTVLDLFQEELVFLACLLADEVLVMGVEEFIRGAVYQRLELQRPSEFEVQRQMKISRRKTQIY